MKLLHGGEHDHDHECEDDVNDDDDVDGDDDDDDDDVLMMTMMTIIWWWRWRYRWWWWCKFTICVIFCSLKLHITTLADLSLWFTKKYPAVHFKSGHENI